MSQTFKCGHVRLFAYWLSHELSEMLRRSVVASEYREIRALAAWSFVSYLQVLKYAGPVLTDEEQKLAYEHRHRFLLQYQVLAELNEAAGKRRYKIRPKSHHCCHLVDMCRTSRLNTRYGENWLEEDLLGKWSRLMAACHSATNMTRAMQRFGRVFLQLFPRCDDAAD